jgi:glycosyltransferase involved in cell wall biosynthesis
MELSIVIPCFRAEDSLRELTERIIRSVSGFAAAWEIILVHDAGSDNTWQVIKELSETHSCVNGVNLMRNLGQHRATLCGFSYASGEIIVTLDDDLQHPPEEIEKMYRFLSKNEKVDAVFGSYEEKQHGWFRNLGTIVQRQIRKKIFPDAAGIHITSFRAFRRPIVKELLRQRQTNPRIGLMTLSVTSRVVNISVVHHRRKHGRSNYSIAKLIKTAIVPIINYSSLPLKMISTLGAAVTLVSFFLALYYIVGYFSAAISVPGFTTLVVVILFSTGLTLFSFGIIGEYLKRIIEQQMMTTRFPIREDTFTMELKKGPDL